MAHTVPHYQTAFSIGGFEGPADPVFTQAQDILRRWVLKKENSRTHRFNNKAYGFSPDVRFATGSEGKSWVSAYRTESGDIEGGAAWALEYTHKDDDVEGLSWRNEATLHVVDEGRRIAVSLSIVKELSPELFQKENVRLPDPATPQCVRRFFDALEGARLLSGAVDATPPAGRLLRVVETEDDAKRLVEDIRSPSRTLPLLLLVGASTGPSNFAESLAHDLVGKALVCNVPNRPALLAPFQPFKAGFGHCRILFPFNRFGPRLRAHPLRSFAKPEEAEALRAFVKPLLLAKFTAVEPGAIAGAATLSAQLARARLARFRAELFRKGANPVDAAQWEAYAKELLLENKRLGSRRAELEQEVRNLRDKLFTLSLNP